VSRQKRDAAQGQVLVGSRVRGGRENGGRKGGADLLIPQSAGVCLTCETIYSCQPYMYVTDNTKTNAAPLTPIDVIRLTRGIIISFVVVFLIITLSFLFHTVVCIPSLGVCL
jgi:hypothetical protein